MMTFHDYQLTTSRPASLYRCDADEVDNRNAGDDQICHLRFCHHFGAFSVEIIIGRLRRPGASVTGRALENDIARWRSALRLYCTFILLFYFMLYFIKL